MQARKIDLTPYSTEVLVNTVVDLAAKKLVDVMATRETDPQIWIRRHILSTTAQHNAESLARAMDIAGKIRAAAEAGEDSVLLDQADWDFVNGIVKRIKGYTESDYEMAVRRVGQAPTVEVDEK